MELFALVTVAAVNAASLLAWRFNLLPATTPASMPLRCVEANDVGICWCVKGSLVTPRLLLAVKLSAS
jgi:hypothetical protein